eukprot:6175869-Pleurochrysis_carterae.AAC.1
METRRGIQRKATQSSCSVLHFAIERPPIRRESGEEKREREEQERESESLRARWNASGHARTPLSPPSPLGLEQRPPTCSPPMNTCGKDVWPVISPSLARIALPLAPSKNHSAPSSTVVTFALTTMEGTHGT